MKNSFILLLHLAFWFLFFIFLGGMAFIGENVSESSNEFAYYFELLIGFILIPCLVTFYGFYSWLFPNYLQKEKWGASVFYSLMITLVGVAIGLIYLLNFTVHSDNSLAETCIQQGMIFMTIIAFMVGFVGVVLKGFVTWIEELKLKAALEQKNHEMEMALVKAQLDPHFLFNTINNIDVLILKDAEEASNYLNKLSDIMRFMLFETKPNEILLSKELEYIEKYIALQKIRTANDNYVNYSVKGNAQDRTIAPMVFIPFIENAFKHATNKKLDHAIDIDIVIEDQAVKMACKNKYDPFRKIQKDSNGLGNELIKKRLDLIYPDQHQLTFGNGGDLYWVNLTIEVAA